MRGCVVLWVVAVVVAGAVASSQHQLAVAWLVLSVQVTQHHQPSDIFILLLCDKNVIS